MRLSDGAVSFFHVFIFASSTSTYFGARWKADTERSRPTVEYIFTHDDVVFNLSDYRGRIIQAHNINSINSLVEEEKASTCAISGL